MQVVSATTAIPESLKGAVIAIGNFDGLHRGHQELLKVAKTEAARRGSRWGILTFEPHPGSFFRPAEPVFRLTPAALKERLAAALGADLFAVANFDEHLSSRSPEEFVLGYLVKWLGVSHVVTGYDFHFGKGRKGTPETLRQLGEQNGFGVTTVDQVTDDADGNAPFSSSSIRSAIRRGHVRAAAHDLGYRWIVKGEVVHGDKRGRTIGFPTANIIVDPGAEPARGIYAVEVRDADVAPGTPAWLGAAYFGDRPTFNTNRTFLETYLLDVDMDLYGRKLLVSFHDLIRGDKTFSSVGDLVEQMKNDCDDARRILAHDRANDEIAAFPLGKLQREGRL
ncbi:MAG: bifunctional riboflavin kinase/FAD synthetase [Rhizobiales bacterium]|nr:bifunctional riboflavin kinase/FAD synthetase [Hyphomicrobiales bacterium]